MKKLTTIILGTALLLGSTAYGETNYTPPDLKGFNLDKPKYFDKSNPEDGKKETFVKRHKNTLGEKIFSYKTNRKIWAWGRIGLKRDPNDLEKTYVIMDTDCNGTFDKKLRADEDFYLPECVK